MPISSRTASSEVKMVRKSPLWKHFDRVNYKGLKYARCKDSSCESYSNPAMYVPVRADCSTSALWRHLRAYHPEINEMEMENPKQLRRSRRLKLKVNILPEELLLRIFEYMSYKQLMAVVLVCKRWRLIGETPTLWSEFPITVTNWNQAAMPMILKYRRLQLLKEIRIEAELWDYVNQAIWRHPNIVTLRFTL